MCTSLAVHPDDCKNGEAPIKNDMNVGKSVTSSATVTVAIPIVDSSVPIALDKGRSSFSTWTICQKHNPNPETSTPWCKLSSQSTLLITEVAFKGSEVQNFIRIFLQLKMSGDSSNVTRATILASLSSLRLDLSHWISPS
ncbi:hypothetical protein GOBAR_AA37148 [Gossypium barbadense]|uniref:Uncharacterized protein n=1 Tax=Gossypium barbadense TaxID=3634 RepID=A0A2P5VXK5_GOSBA|nr:hypothetical protein GOBAR_AA37148 [Gossypium barbadense]